jgi:hypothetical protein
VTLLYKLTLCHVVILKLINFLASQNLQQKHLKFCDIHWRTSSDLSLNVKYTVATQVQHTVTNSVNNHVIKFGNSTKDNFILYE